MPKNKNIKPLRCQPPQPLGSAPHHLGMSTVTTKVTKSCRAQGTNISLVEQFAQVSITQLLEHSLDVRLVLLYGSMVAVGNELAELRRRYVHFLLSFYHMLYFLLQDNIQKYSRLILLSPSIYHYKGKVPREYLIVSEGPSLRNRISDIPLRKLF